MTTNRKSTFRTLVLLAIAFVFESSIARADLCPDIFAPGFDVNQITIDQTLIYRKQARQAMFRSDQEYKELRRETIEVIKSVVDKFENQAYPWQRNSNSLLALRSRSNFAESQKVIGDLNFTIHADRESISSRRGRPDLRIFESNEIGRWYFYSLTKQLGKARAMWITDLVRQTFMEDSLPVSHVGNFEGEVGVFNLFVPGTPLGEYRGKINRDAFHRMLAVDFLVQHQDTHTFNFIVTPGNQLVGIDYEQVLRPTNIERVFDRRALDQDDFFGHILPPEYPADFLAKLKVLTPERIFQAWESKLAIEEIETFLLTREMILAHAEMRAAALSEPPRARTRWWWPFSRSN